MEYHELLLVDVYLAEIKLPKTHKSILDAMNLFDKEFERELKEYVLTMESRFFGLTCDDLRRIAYQVAEKMVLLADSIQRRKWLERSGCMPLEEEITTLHFVLLSQLLMPGRQGLTNQQSTNSTLCSTLSFRSTV